MLSKYLKCFSGLSLFVYFLRETWDLRNLKEDNILLYNINVSFLDSKVDCLEQFGQEANRAITQDDDVLCTTEYSRIVPLENGEVSSFGRPWEIRLKYEHEDAHFL